jgi:hypothetical protein
LFRPLAAAAQSGPQSLAPQITRPSPQSEKQELYRLLDQINAAIRSEDWSEAWRLNFKLSAAIATFRTRTGGISPDLELAHLEMIAGKDVLTRAPQLPRLARAAYNARQFTKAEGYATEALEAAKHGEFPWTGDAIHQGNIVLGRLAYRKGDVQGAIAYLLAAGKTPGSPALGSLGPNMGLARDLLLGGQSAAVIQYLEECRAFWIGGSRKLAEWLALTRAGLSPDFGENLDY